MSRAEGRRRGTAPMRQPEVAPGSDEGRDIGLSDRMLGGPSPIPGGEEHLLNHQTMRQTAPAPVPRPEYRGTMAHGVPPGTHSAHERADAMRGPNSAHDPRPPLVYARPVAQVPPVPVIVVEDGRDVRSLRTSSHRRYQVPAAGTEPIRLCGRNTARKSVMLLNEDSAHNARFSQTIADLVAANSGSLLVAGAKGYLELDTQDELYAVADDTNTPYVCVIEIFTTGQSEVQ
jgi:hypothetical protein